VSSSGLGMGAPVPVAAKAITATTMERDERRKFIVGC
jgi:hypothetical protein